VKTSCQTGVRQDNLRAKKCDQEIRKNNVWVNLEKQEIQMCVVPLGWFMGV